MTFPDFTSIEMSLIAITLLKYFESFLVSSSASSFVSLIGSPPSFDEVAEDHRGQQHGADEDLIPVPVDPGDHDPLLQFIMKMNAPRAAPIADP